MTKQEFVEIAQTLRACYCNDERLLSTKEMLDIWYKKLGHIDYEIAEQAIDNWVKTNRYSPMISDILSECETVSKRIEIRAIEEKRCPRLERVVVLEDDESNGAEFGKDRALHPFEKGWRIDDDGYWIQIGV